MFNRDLVIKLREYGFPLWAIIGSLKLNHGDYDKAFEELKSIYCVVGDYPEVVIHRNEENLRHRINNCE